MKFDGLTELSDMHLCDDTGDHTPIDLDVICKHDFANPRLIINASCHVPADRECPRQTTPTSSEIVADADVDAVVKSVVALYTDHEAFHVDRCVHNQVEQASSGDGGGDDEDWLACTIQDVASSCGVHVQTWTMFMMCKIRSMFAWELCGLPVNLDTDTDNGEDTTSNGSASADTVLPGRAAFLFKAWINDPVVRDALKSRGLILDDAGPSVQQSNTGDEGGADSATGDASLDPSLTSAQEVIELLRTKFGIDDDAVDGTRGTPEGYFKWSAISRIAQVGNPNFKKFRCTKRFTDRVSNELADTCKREGMAHMLSPEVALAVLRMCDKV